MNIFASFMQWGNVYQQIKALRLTKRKGFALLIDPDKVSPAEAFELANKSSEANVDFIFVGGSLMLSQQLDICIQQIKSGFQGPVILFPGSPSQLSPYADALLYLSLISGRNPELLIGAHVVSAPAVKASGLEVISTGYMVIDGGQATTVSYMSHSAPIPHDKDDIALCTALAGELQGKHLLYLDAGSGARHPVSTRMIRKVVQHTQLPLVVGGGIRNPETAYETACAGADIVVVGNAIEHDASLIREMSLAIHQVDLQPE